MPMQGFCCINQGHDTQHLRFRKQPCSIVVLHRFGLCLASTHHAFTNPDLIEVLSSFYFTEVYRSKPSFFLLSLSFFRQICCSALRVEIFHYPVFHLSCLKDYHQQSLSSAFNLSLLSPAIIAWLWHRNIQPDANRLYRM